MVDRLETPRRFSRYHHTLGAHLHWHLLRIHDRSLRGLLASHWFQTDIEHRYYHYDNLLFLGHTHHVPAVVG